MGWTSRVLLMALLFLALAMAKNQADAQASGGKAESSTAAEPSSGGKSSKSSRSSSKTDTATEAASSVSTEASTRKSRRRSRKNQSSTEATISSASEATTEKSPSRRRKSRKNSSTEASSVETSTEASTSKSRRRNRNKGSTEAPVEASTEATKRKSRQRNRKGSTTEAPPPEPSTPSSRRKNRNNKSGTSTQAPPSSTTRCNRACRRRLKAARRRTATTKAPKTTTTTTTTPPPPLPTPLPLDPATVAYLISTNPALHVINERILLTAAYAYSDDNEVVCIFCLLQLFAAAHTMGNDFVRREIETALQSREPGRLGEALLQLVSGAPMLSGTFAGLYQKDAVPTCDAQPAWRRDDRCYTIERFVNMRGTQVDFTQSETTSLINTLVERATSGMIQDLFPPLPVSSQLVFASVLVFRDTWKQRLYWQPGSFTTFYGNLSAETLIQQDYVPLLDGSSDGVIGVSLPYYQPGIRMMLFTTSDGSSVVERLRTVHYRALAAAPLTYTTVFFPRFSVWSNKYSYADLAQQMGISAMFRGGLGLGNRLRMELFVQKAVISADVDGSDSLSPAPEAVWDGDQHPEPVQVVFDRPFVCSLVHAELDVPFFTGIIRDPTRFY